MACLRSGSMLFVRRNVSDRDVCIRCGMAQKVLMRTLQQTSDLKDSGCSGPRPPVIRVLLLFLHIMCTSNRYEYIVHVEAA